MGIAITGTGAMTEAELKKAGGQLAATRPRGRASSAAFQAIVYIVAFVTGAIVMSFEMLGSRYLNPYFGSSIYTWAALISTVLAALDSRLLPWRVHRRSHGVGSRTRSDRRHLRRVYLLALPSFAEAILEFVLDTVDNVRLGSLYSALAIMFLPVTLLGVYSPFAIRLLLRSTQHSGAVSGTVYGVSTAGSIAGTLGTTFFLIPPLERARSRSYWARSALVAGLSDCTGSYSSVGKRCEVRSRAHRIRHAGARQ